MTTSSNPSETDRLRRIDSLLEAALELPPEGRAAFLDGACGEDAALRREVEALLAYEAEAESFLETEAVDRAAALLAAQEEAVDLPPGRVLGAYRIVRELGRGGMGTVYLAERADGQFRHQVALKVVRRGLDTDDVLSRFRYERQILASLDHPHIAALYDGGVTEDGRPYFVMEYVDGRPITDYCNAHRLDTDRRLALLLTVCRAVQYAHRNLVIHRDLKPGNILVTGDGRVKLLDFGIAKLLDEEAGEGTALRTRTGLRPMTPAYAAPEQIRGETVTTATDVYQLGVLLYELLTGRHPYRIDRQVRREVERVILEEEPVRPSTMLLDEPAPAASARQTTAERLRRRLSGDLDKIVLMTLKKSPERRYGSVEQFAEDLQRHLRGLPVVAQGDAVGYRVRTFVRRHRLRLAAAAVLLLLLVGYAATVTVQSRRIAAERDRAFLEAQKATQVSTFMRELFRMAKPSVAKGEVVSVQDALHAGAERIRSQLQQQPSVRAALMTEIGRSYLNMGLFAEADTLLEEALALYAEVDDPAPLDLAGAHYSLGELKDASYDIDAAERHYRASLALYRSVLGPEDDHYGFVSALGSLGGLLGWNRGAYDEAEVMLRESISLAERLYERYPEDEAHRDLVPYNAGLLAYVLQQRGDVEEAEAIYRRSIAFLEANDSEENVTLLDHQYLLASLLSREGRLGEAERLFLRLIPLERRVYGPDNPNHAYTLDVLGQVHLRQGRPAEALPRFREAIRIRQLSMGDEHPLTLGTTVRLAEAYAALARPDSAALLYGNTLAECRRLHPVCARPDVRNADFLDDLLLGYGTFLLERRRPAEAAALLRESLSLRDERGDTLGAAEVRRALESMVLSP